MSDFDLLSKDDYQRLITALGGQELFVGKKSPILKELLGDKAEDFIQRFCGDRIYIKKHVLAHIKQRQIDYVHTVRDKCQRGASISVAIKQTAKEFGISERWGYELYARFKGGKLSHQPTLF